MNTEIPKPNATSLAEANRALTEAEEQRRFLGQFIPLHYHHNMLLDENRMSGFKAAIGCVVFPGAKVLELGGGTGVLSWFAAAKASKVWCVEMNPELAREARRLLGLNPGGDKVEVVQADAFEYLPPEPVDVVICEMLHTAMLRERQVEVIESFKARYAARFGGKLPIFVPEASIMAVQPLQQNYDFKGFHAPIIEFQFPYSTHQDSIELASPKVYATLDYSDAVPLEFAWSGEFPLSADGNVNALRFITKNILAIEIEAGSTIDWMNQYMVLPLAEPISARNGDSLRVEFHYRAGASLASLQEVMRASLVAG